MRSLGTTASTRAWALGSEKKTSTSNNAYQHHEIIGENDVFNLLKHNWLVVWNMIVIFPQIDNIQ